MSEPSSQQKSKHFFGHPIGLSILFLTEMWERFSYYGMRNLLRLYAESDTGLGWTEHASSSLYGLYCMSVYLLAIPGGFIANRYIGKKRAVLLGASMQCLGHFLLAISGQTGFILGLASIAIGTGLLKSNISSLVGGLYVAGDTDKDQGFKIFYTGINMGALLATATPLIASDKGAWGLNWGWHYGFGAAGIGMLFSIVVFSLYGYLIPAPAEEKDNLPTNGISKLLRDGIPVWGLLGLMAIAVYGIGIDICTEFIQTYYQWIQNIFASTCLLAIAGYLVHRTLKAESKQERDRMIAFSIALIIPFIFFIAFEQAGNLMTVYAKKYVRRTLLGREIPAAMIQQLNPLFVVMFSVLVGRMWGHLRKRYKYMNDTYQMSVGNIILGLGFLFMMGASWERVASADHTTGLYWLVGAYFLHTIGELCLSPVLLSFTTKVAPKDVGSLTMGITFAILGLSNHFASELGSLSSSLGEYKVWQIACYVPIGLGLLFLLFNHKLIALTHGADGQVDEGNKDAAT